MARRVAGPLARIAEAERRALLEGRVDELPIWAEAKAGALAELATDRDSVLAAKAELSRNATMISAALSGLRAARKRGEERRALTQGFSTYQRSGEKVRIGRDPSRRIGPGKLSSNRADPAAGD